MTLLPDIASLTLTQKIGQMCLFGFRGHSPSGEFSELLHRECVGNIIFFSRNFEDVHGIRELCREFYRDMSIPPFLAIDQEGGVVMRIREGVTQLPGNMAVAATGEPRLAHVYGAIVARELRALGINLNLAPVLDCNRAGNPGVGVRSFGESPEFVSTFGTAMIAGMRSEHIFSTAKHFPGIGAARLDTHHNMPVIEKSLSQLESADIFPFRSAIESGVDFIMTSHAAYPAFSPEGLPVPATLSPDLMKDYLRERLGFSGVLITDDLEMGALGSSRSFGETVVGSVTAGADIITVCNDPEKQRAALTALHQAVDEGVIPVDRIDESIRRIFAAKAKLTARSGLFFLENIDELVSHHRPAVQDIIRRSVTVSDTANRLPLNLTGGDSLLVAVPRLMESTPVEELRLPLERAEKRIFDHFLAHHGNVRQMRFSLPPNSSEASAMYDLAESADCVVLCSYNAYLDEKQSDMITAVASLSTPLILFMLRDPNDRFISPGISTSVAVYAPVEDSITAGIDTMFSR